MVKAAIVVGNPKAKSRTMAVAETLMRAVIDCIDHPVETTVIDLADHTDGMFAWENATLEQLRVAVSESALLVVASPTYKASYTGLLKAFFDRYPTDGLTGVVAVPVMVGGTPTHALAPEVFLRPLLVELGATVPTRALYVLESQLPSLDGIVNRWADDARPLITARSRPPEAALLQLDRVRDRRRWVQGSSLALGWPRAPDARQTRDSGDAGDTPSSGLRAKTRMIGSSCTVAFGQGHRPTQQNRCHSFES